MFVDIAEHERVGRHWKNNTRNTIDFHHIFYWFVIYYSENTFFMFSLLISILNLYNNLSIFLIIRYCDSEKLYLLEQFRTLI